MEIYMNNVNLFKSDGIKILGRFKNYTVITLDKAAYDYIYSDREHGAIFNIPINSYSNEIYALNNNYHNDTIKHLKVKAIQ